MSWTCCLLGLCTPKNRVRGEEEPPVTEEDQVMELLRNLNPYRPEGAERRKANVTAKLIFMISIIFERFGTLREVPYD